MQPLPSCGSTMQTASAGCALLRDFLNFVVHLPLLMLNLRLKSTTVNLTHVVIHIKATTYLVYYPYQTPTQCSR